MAMTYTSLVATKGTVGSIANWVNYSKVETNLPTILDEAQALIYQLLRVREMQTTMHFKMTAGLSRYALPARFLDPIGEIHSTNQNFTFAHKIDSTVKTSRPFSVLLGSLGTNPFTTTIGSSQVSVALTAHSFTQGSIFGPSGASAVGGLTLDGAYEVASVTTNAFVIETGTPATSSATGGGAAVTYTASMLTQGTPGIWGIFDEAIQFDQAFDATHLLNLAHYQSLPLLSPTNTSNFLTNRHPQILRAACVAAAEDFMKDTEEYNKAMTRLTALIDKSQYENDLIYRGAELDTWNPQHAG